MLLRLILYAISPYTPNAASAIIAYECAMRDTKFKCSLHKNYSIKSLEFKMRWFFFFSLCWFSDLLWSLPVFLFDSAGFVFFLFKLYFFHLFSS